MCLIEREREHFRWRWRLWYCAKGEREEVGRTVGDLLRMQNRSLLFLGRVEIAL